MPKVKSIARGLKAAAVSLMTSDEGSTRVVAGKKLVCTHCGGSKWVQRSGNVTTDFRVGMWADGATLFVCTQCKRIEWFADSL
jgi:hypothetical protein